MQGEIAYRQIVLSERGKEKLRLPLLAPINDMLGLTNPRGGYLTYLRDRYGTLGFPRRSPDAAHGFVDAGRAATKGHLAASLAGHLERLRFSPDGTVADVPDFAALAAWSLLEAVRRQPLKLRTCRTCGRPWLAAADEKSRYCQRWAPSHAKDCRTLAYEHQVAGDSAYRAYRREYNRLTEANRRGSLDTLDLFEWRENNDATNWIPFDEWKEQHG